MKRYRAAGGPFEYRLSFSTTEIDEICIEALTQANCLPPKPEPVRIDRFVEKHITNDVGYEDLEEGILGYTAFKKDGAVHAVRISTKAPRNNNIIK
jgi:hypothetical protein